MTTPVISTTETYVQASINSITDEVTQSLPSHTSAVPMLPDQTPEALLSRLRLVRSFNWSAASTGVLAVFDLEAALSSDPLLAPILNQFSLYRSDYLIKIRINTNQFYAGAMMVTYWPDTRGIGTYREQRQMFRPVTISLATQQAAEIQIPFLHPSQWLPTPRRRPFSPPNPTSTWICFEVLAPMNLSTPALSDVLEVDVFAQFLNPQVTLNESHYPQSKVVDSDLPSSLRGTNWRTLHQGVKPQSDPTSWEVDADPAPPATKFAHDSGAKVHPQSKRKPRKAPRDLKPEPSTAARFVTEASRAISTSTTPAEDAQKKVENGGNKPVPFTELAPTLSSIPILGDVVGGLFDLIRLGVDAVGTAAPILSAVGPLIPMILDKPETTAETIRVFSTIGTDQFSSDVSSTAIAASCSQNSYLTPIVEPSIAMSNWTLAEYAMLPGIQFAGPLPTSVNLNLYDGSHPLGYLTRLFNLYRGSTRFHLQFFASAFTTTRVQIAFKGALATTNMDAINTILDIKGDTVSSFTVPYLQPQVWTNAFEDDTAVLNVQRIAPIVTSDASVTPYVYMVAWISGGPDVQFAQPREVGWVATQTSPLPVLDEHKEQSSIWNEFKHGKFSPIVDGCSFVLDNGYAVSDPVVTFADLLKRYQKAVPSVSPNLVLYNELSYNYVHNRQAPFLSLRGGYLMKFKSPNAVQFLATRSAGGGSAVLTMGWSLPSDAGWHTLAIPYTSPLPWINRYASTRSYIEIPFFTPDENTFLAYRDDIEVGWPMLPISYV